jgi:hypothetical protein
LTKGGPSPAERQFIRVFSVTTFSRYATRSAGVRFLGQVTRGPKGPGSGLLATGTATGRAVFGIEPPTMCMRRDYKRLNTAEK